MPDLDLIRELAKQSLQPEFDWLRLIELRKNAIMEQIENFGQQQLGTVEYWITRGAFGSQVNEGDPELNGDSRIPLTTRGVFMFDRSTFSERHGSQPLIYGFDRRGNWIFARVGTNDAGRKTVYCQYWEPRFFADRFGLQPKQVFLDLGEVIRQHAENRKHLAKIADQLWQRTLLENRILERM